MTAFRVAPDTFLSESLGLHPTFLVFSKALYPAGLLACEYAGSAFNQVRFDRLYPKKRRTAFCSRDTAEQMQRMLQRLTPALIKRNWVMGWFIREHLATLINPGCDHFAIRGCGLLMHTSLPLSKQYAKIVQSSLASV